MTTQQITNQRLTTLMCKVSKGVYNKVKEKRYGIKACYGELDDKTIEDLFEDIELLSYFTTTKNTIVCDLDKLIENLT